MAVVDCSPIAGSGQPRSIALIQSGAVVPVILRSGFGQEEAVSALIDTGSEASLIDIDLVTRLQAQWIDRWTIARPGALPSASSIDVDVFQVEIEIPSLGIREFTGMAAAIEGQKHQAILGRKQLRSCTLIYDGPKGTVSLSR